MELYSRNVENVLIANIIRNPLTYNRTSEIGVHHTIGSMNSQSTNSTQITTSVHVIAET
jgi:hypothetical protein